MEIWESKLLGQVKALGFESLADYLKNRPGIPYPDLANEIGPSVLGVQIADFQLRQANRAGRESFRDAARDALVRCLRQVLPRGWGSTESADGVAPDFVNITAWTQWASLIKRVSPGDKRTDSIWDELDARAPDGWLPAGPDDAVLKATFDAGWPG